MLAASKSKKVNSPSALAFEDAYSMNIFLCIFAALEATVDDCKDFEDVLLVCVERHIPAMVHMPCFLGQGWRAPGVSGSRSFC